jgi:cytochrome c553
MTVPKTTDGAPPERFLADGCTGRSTAGHLLCITRRYCGVVVFCVVGFLADGSPISSAQMKPSITPDEASELVARGRYLAIIGVCSACHTPPNVPERPGTGALEVNNERIFRTDPDWYKYLDPNGANYLAGGVPFILRLGSNLSGIVYTTNITSDPVDGVGSWTEAELADAIRSGRRPKKAVSNDRPEYLYLFPPHSFYRNLAKKDALALAFYLKRVPPKKNAVRIPARQLPAEFEPNADSNPFGPIAALEHAPTGRSVERAQYLLRSLVGCRECHSHHSNDPRLVGYVPEHQERMDVFQRGAAAIREYKRNNEWDPAEPFMGPLIPFAGGGHGDPYQGAFRLGPDLPLRASDKGVALFPYPGYAVLYGSNLTRFGNNGPFVSVTTAQLVNAMRQGISTQPDEYGRRRPLSQVMMWPFYSSLTDDDAYSIAEFIKTLTYISNIVPAITYYGTDWEGMFAQIFGAPPDDHDRKIFGKLR